MKYFSLIIIALMAISCSKNEHSKKTDNRGELTPQAGMTVGIDGRVTDSGGDGKYCQYENSVIYGSYAYIVGDHNITIQWNNYYDKTHAASTVLVIKDDAGNMFTTKPIKNTNTYTLHNNSVGSDGRLLKDSFTLTPYKFYWIHTESYNNYYNPSLSHNGQHIVRETIDIYLEQGKKEIIAGFCSYKPYWWTK